MSQARGLASPSLEGRGRVKAETRVRISGPAQEIEP